AGDHRFGRRTFVSIGCAACHYLPDVDRAEQPTLGQTPLTNLQARFPPEELAAFLVNPHGRYPDERMPKLPLSPKVARDIAAYLLLWSKPATKSGTELKSPAEEEIQT